LNRIQSMMMVLAAGWLGVGAATAQTAANLNILSGNGQVVCPQCASGVVASATYVPMVVQATDVNGNPLPGVTVNWTITSPGIIGVFSQSGTNSFTATTDVNGESSVTFLLTQTQAGSPLFSVAQDTIVASTTNNLTATFYLSEALQDPLNLGRAPLTASPTGTSLVQGSTYSGAAGSTYSAPIQIYVANEAGGAVPNVSVFLVDAQVTSSTGAPTIACAPTPGAGVGLVLSGSNGLATCYPVFGGSPGSGLFWVEVGGAQASAPSTTPPNFPALTYLVFPSNFYNTQTGAVGGYNYTVTPGTVSSSSTIGVVSGNGQSTSAGQTLSQPLVVQILNSSGQPVSGVTVNWTVSPAGAATLSSTSTTGTNGQASNTVTLSSIVSGTVTVTASAVGTTSSATFTITVAPAVTITGFSIVSGNSQTAIEGTAFSQPLVVQVTTSNGSASGIPVQFQVESGPVTLSSNTATTNSSGQAQVTATAGTLAGPATILATVTSTGGGSSQTFNLTVIPQPTTPAITAANFVNGADQQLNSLSPCSLGLMVAASLGIANLQPLFPGLPAPQTNVTISFNGTQAPILNIGNNALGQQFVLFQVPCTVTPASNVPVVVNIAGGSTNLTLNVQPASPGIFRTVVSPSQTIAVLVRPDGSYVSETNPARRGETEVAYVTGLGPTSPSVATTALPVPLGTPATVLGTVIPGMNGGGVPLLYAQLSEDLPGIYLVAFQVPTTLPQGNDTLSIGIIPQGSTTAYYSALATVPVQ